jgi:hypothetical protein
MKTKEQIEEAIKQCDVAQKKGKANLCPVWPEDTNLYCVDCTCRYAWRWILEIEEFES